MQKFVPPVKTTRSFRIGAVLLTSLLLVSALCLVDPLTSPVSVIDAVGHLYQSWPWWVFIIGAASCALALLVFGNEILNRIFSRYAVSPPLQKPWLLQPVINAIPAPIFYKDHTGVYLGCNEAFEKYLGLPREKIVGSTVYDVAPKDLADIYSSADQSLLVSGGTQTYETSVRYADGSRHEVIFHKSVFHRPDGQIAGLVGTLVDITERKSAEAMALYLAHFDPLTELPNQLLLTDRIHQAIVHAHRLNQQFAIFCLDLDHFKKINNAYGHPQGDKLLKKVGKRIAACLREDDTVARMGGDSFNLLLPNIGSDESAGMVAQKIIDSLKVPFDLGERDVFVTASIGVAIYPYDGHEAATLLKNADIALQRAKEGGRNGHHFFDQAMNTRAENQMSLELQLRRAIEGNEFSLYFQPQINAVNGRIIGAEALIRWHDPEKGIIMPDLFIPLAEQTGLINSIGVWALHAACAQASSWQKSGLPPLRIAVNLSPRQFQRADIYREVDRALKETGLPPECLSLEVTESAIMQDVDHAIETLVRLKNLGVHLAIDDFGTGYSSLSYLKRFPIDLLKIDRSFIMDIPNVPDDIAIVSAVIAMAHQLNIKVLAEGVQSAEQRDILLSHHCDELQGYLFSKPLPADDFFSGIRTKSDIDNFR